MRNLRVLNLALLVALCLGAVVAWGVLPERVPTHFDARGVPDAWSKKSFWSWFLLPITALVTTLIMYVTIRTVRRRPDLLNVPRKQQLLQLAEQDQAPIMSEIGSLMEGVTLFVLVIFCIIQFATFQAARGASVQGLMMLVLLIALLGTPVLAGLLLVRTSRQIDTAYRRARAEGRLRT